MAKESGIGMTVTIDNSSGTGKDISNDISACQFGTPRNMQDVTGLDKSAMERIALLADAQVQVTIPAFNDTTDKSFDVLKDDTGVRTVAIAISGNTLSMEMLISDRQWNRNNDGSLGMTATFQLQSGTVPAWA